MRLFHARRTTSLIVVVLGFCTMFAPGATAADATARHARQRHHNRQPHNRPVHHNRAVHHNGAVRHDRVVRHVRHRCAVASHRRHRGRRTHALRRTHVVRGWRCASGHRNASSLTARKRLSTLGNTALPPPPPALPVTGVAGAVKTRLDAKSEFDQFPIAWFKPLTRIMAYPPGGDRYAAAGVPTLAYHDAWTKWGSGGASHVGEYVAWVQRDKEHGYLGQFMDDVNFAGGHIAGTPAQYADLIEAVRNTLGPQGVIEINAQMWDLKSMLGNPDVQRALRYVNVVTKEFNVSPRSGISNPSKYAEYLEFVDGLRAKGIGITNTGDSSYNSEADKEYSLASYLLVNTGLDFIGFNHQSPLNEYPAIKGMNLGEETQPRTQLPSGLWTRMFSHGEAIVAPPGTSGSVSLPRALTRIGSSSPVTSVTLSGGQGAVLLG
jgi:hypothetical protein